MFWFDQIYSSESNASRYSLTSAPDSLKTNDKADLHCKTQSQHTR